MKIEKFKICIKIEKYIIDVDVDVRADATYV